MQKQYCSFTKKVSEYFKLIQKISNNVADMKLTKLEIDLIYSQLLLNSKIIALIENKLECERVKTIHGKEGQLAFYSPKKQTVFFPAKTDTEGVVDLFVRLNRECSIKLVEGPKEVIEKIGIHLSNIQTIAYQSNMLVLTHMIDETIERVGVEWELVKGTDLLNFGIEAIVGKYSQEKLGENINKDEIKALILSASREFIGLKMNNKIVSIGALTRQHQDHRCISYIYTNEEYRGRGFARAILSSLLNEAKGKYKSVFLFVDKANVTAMALYRKCGFMTAGAVSQLKIQESRQYAKP